MGWFARVKAASAAQRVTRSDTRQAMETLEELKASAAERQRLLRDGIAGIATVVAIRQAVATTALGTWHELTLEVEVPNCDPYRATRRVALELASAPQVAVGAKVPVRVDPHDRSTVLIVANL